MANEARVSRRVKKVAVGIALTAIGLTGAIGLMHKTEWGKEFLMKAGGCPVGKVTPAELEHLRNNAIANSDQSTAPAPAVFALGFDLDKTTIEDTKKWAVSHNLDCDTQKDDTILSCKNVPVSTFPRAEGGTSNITELVFGFRVSDKELYTVTAWRRDVPADVIAKDLDGVIANLEPQFGQGTATGDRSASGLNEQMMATATVAYKYKGYDISLTATKMPKGVWMRELYVSTKGATTAQGS